MTFPAKTFKIVFPLLLWIAAVPSLEAADPGQYFNPLAGIGLGAREAALGGAFVAVPGGLDSLSSNIAGLAVVGRPQGAWHHLSWIGGVTRETAEFAVPSAHWGVMVGSYQYDFYPEQEQRDATSAVVGEFRPRRDELTFGWARTFGGHLMAGIALSQQRLTLAGDDFSSFSADAGVLWGFLRYWRLGASVDNAATYVGSAASASFYRFGLAWEPKGKSPLSLASLECTYQPYGVSRVRMGVERALAPALFLRVGYQLPIQDDRIAGFQDLTAGFGWDRANWRLDYAYQAQGEFGSSHRVSFRVALAAPAPIPTATPTPTATATWSASPTPTSTPSPTPTATTTLSAPATPERTAQTPVTGPKDRLKLYFDFGEESPSPTPALNKAPAPKVPPRGK